jgi:hypothetical protein
MKMMNFRKRKPLKVSAKHEITDTLLHISMALIETMKIKKRLQETN